MKQDELRRHLAEAEAQLAEGLLSITKQRATIAALEQDSPDTARANELLATLLRSHSVVREHRDLLLRALAATAGLGSQT